MTNIGRRNVAIKIEGCTLFDDFDGAKEYLLNLIRKDIEYHSDQYMTLKEAIYKYGDDNIMYYINDLDSIGIVRDNGRGASAADAPVFRYTFETVVVKR